MPRSIRKNSPSRTGTLRIGDQWNAINIIARSQAHPLKAVRELVENAIDARADQIEITRQRLNRQVFLEVADNGSGVAPNAEGEPDFARIATHVCDSMKRHLDGDKRSGIHGEFGIGLLSFWSLGESLRIISGGTGGAPFEMELRAGKKSYTLRPARGRLGLGGTRVVVGPLFDAARKVVTGEKLTRYLASELRDRIRASGVVVQVIDRLVHKSLLVRPQEFLGERIPCPEHNPTNFGPLRVELYLCDGADGRGEGVAVCKDGTRVLRSVTDLDMLQRSPWTEGRLEGVIDYPALALAPGTRSGIVPDERLSAFVDCVTRIEPTIIEAVEAREHARTEKASMQILRQLKRAFVSALRGLPPSEYLFFDLPKAQEGLQTNGSDAEPRMEASTINAATTLPRTPTGPIEDLEAQSILPFEPGPLASVVILPRHPRSRPGAACAVRAVALDEHGQPAAGEVSYRWQVVEGQGSVVPDVEKCRVISDVEGIVLVRVEASQEANTLSAQCAVKFLAGASEPADDSPKGLPTYRISAEHGLPWRSRYDEKRNEIVINSAHRDFASSQAPLAKHRRYIGKLYAKEVVLINFPHESPSAVMERLIELTLRTEENL